jgi:hypothetical protein
MIFSRCKFWWGNLNFLASFLASASTLDVNLRRVIIPSSGRLTAIVFEPMKGFSGKYAPNLIGLEKWLPIG